jgi:hypothetical protein
MGRCEAEVIEHRLNTVRLGKTGEVGREIIDLRLADMIQAHILRDLPRPLKRDMANCRQGHR